MKTLNRPMFRYGGPIKEGIMNGIREPKQNGGTIAVGTNNILTITDDTVTLGDGAAVDTSIVFDGNVQDFYVALDDSADDLLIGVGSTVGSSVALSVDENQVVTAETSANIKQVALTDGTVSWDARAADMG